MASEAHKERLSKEAAERLLEEMRNYELSMGHKPFMPLVEELFSGVRENQDTVELRIGYDQSPTLDSMRFDKVNSPEFNGLVDAYTEGKYKIFSVTLTKCVLRKRQ